MRILSDLQDDVPASLDAGVNVLDEVYTSEYGVVRWEIGLTRADGVRLYAQVCAIHNRTDTEATSGQYEESARVCGTKAASKQVTFEVTLVGSGSTQRLRLNATLTAPWWRAHVCRGPLVGTGATA